jgi:prevent-host-death family protein
MLDIRPISDLRNDFTDIEKKVSNSNTPIIFTKNGRGSVVLISLDRYSRMAHLDYIEQSLNEADNYAQSNTENMTHEDVFAKLRTKING